MMKNLFAALALSAFLFAGLWACNGEKPETNASDLAETETGVQTDKANEADEAEENDDVNKATTEKMKEKAKKSQTAEAFEGTIIEKPWTKSGQSYCAQGSEYYVLKTESEEYILEPTDTWTFEKIAAFKDKNVSVSGALVTKEIPTGGNDDEEADMEQRPIEQRPIEQKPVSAFDDEETAEAPYTCTVLEPSDIEEK